MVATHTIPTAASAFRRITRSSSFNAVYLRRLRDESASAQRVARLWHPAATRRTCCCGNGERGTALLRRGTQQRGERPAELGRGPRRPLRRPVQREAARAVRARLVRIAAATSSASVGRRRRGGAVGPHAATSPDTGVALSRSGRSPWCRCPCARRDRHGSVGARAAVRERATCVPRPLPCDERDPSQLTRRARGFADCCGCRRRPPIAVELRCARFRRGRGATWLYQSYYAVSRCGSPQRCARGADRGRHLSRQGLVLIEPMRWPRRRRRRLGPLIFASRRGGTSACHARRSHDDVKPSGGSRRRRVDGRCAAAALLTVRCCAPPDASRVGTAQLPACCPRTKQRLAYPCERRHVSAMQCCRSRSPATASHRTCGAASVGDCWFTRRRIGHGWRTTVV